MKTFRLFISSTFSDFKKERQLLQLKVFPQIKKYCLDKGYKFQPIDLRWGVSNEAQLDQKTLELCLNEVRACKSHPHPNFLVMIGDRYGWVPLPYIIDKVEFDNLLNSMNDDEKSLICKWYREDQNQIPASYILQTRTNEFVDYDIWQEVENKLRIILQNAAKTANLSDEQSRKYYLSATEAEVEEGIIPYHSYTEHQKQLINDDPSLNVIDPDYIFGFLRDNEAFSDASDNDRVNVQQFKNRVKEVLPNSNIFHKQIHNVSDESYLAEFEERVTTFLKAQIDSYGDNRPSDDLGQEIEAQAYFAQQKRKNFLAQETVLEAIASYIASTNNEPLVIYGPSGQGKSSIMAKAIEAAEKTNRKVCYRFIGATPNSSSTKEVLTSIMHQLGVNLEKDDRPEIDKNFSSIEHKKETFEEYSYRIYDAINALKEDVVIFIDAVDQLVNEDQFLWLPSKLAENVKIVISALDDPKYVEDSQYFKILKNKTNNLIEIPVFSEPIRLLRTILNTENRTLQPNQEDYFLEQFNKVQSPLYIIVAAQELKHWKSYNTHLSLADTQHGIIEEFIENLSSIYHHNHTFVHKVLGYIYASRDGLSEYEILQLISTDKEFVKQIAPEYFHINETGDLPLVIWTRFYTQFKPFLSSKYQDGEELLYFFHREFEAVVKSLANQQQEHEAIIKVTQKLIEEYQNEPFDANRWGILFARAISHYTLNYKDNLDIELLCQDLNNEPWCLLFCNFLENDADEYQIMNDYNNSLKCKINLLNFIEIWAERFKSRHDDWIKLKINTLHKLGKSYGHLHKYHDVHKILSQIEKIIEPKINTNIINDFWLKEYVDLQMGYAQKAYVYQDFRKAINYIEKCKLIIEQKFIYSPTEWADYYQWILNDMAMNYNEVDSKVSIELYSKSLNTIEKFKHYMENGDADLVTTLSSIALSYFDIGNNYRSLDYAEKSYEYAKDLYIKYPITHSTTYSSSLNTLAHVLSVDKKNYTRAYELYKECYKIRKTFFDNSPEAGLVRYLLIINNLAAFLNRNSHWESSIKLSKQYIEIFEQYVIDGPLKYLNEPKDTYMIHLQKQIQYCRHINDVSNQKSLLLKLHTAVREKFGYFSQEANAVAFEIDQLNQKEANISRNDPCPCGSGKKYKKCCGKNS